MSAHTTRLLYVVLPLPASLGMQRKVRVKWSSPGGLLEADLESQRKCGVCVGQRNLLTAGNGPDKKVVCVGRKEGCTASTSAQTRVQN